MGSYAWWGGKVTERSRVRGWANEMDPQENGRSLMIIPRLSYRQIKGLLKHHEMQT
jgi:hypothetical protein